MKSIFMIVIYLFLLTSFNVKSQTQMQIEFEKFLDLFPTITWEQVQEAVLDDSIISNTCNELSYSDIRRNMWYEEPQNGPKNVYNHIKNEIQSSDYDFKTPPPHIIDVNGDYVHYEKVGGYASVYAVGKIDISKDIIMLVICSLSDENKNGRGRGRRQLYTFKRSTQQMVSAYETEDDQSYWAILKDYSFLYFENIGRVEIDDDRTSDYRYTHRKLVKILPNGCFREKTIKTGLYEYYGYVQDKDGFANVRKEQRVNSDVIYQVKDSSYIIAYGEPDSKWFEVVIVREPGEINYSVNKKCGYIHRSRLKDIDKWRKSLVNIDFKD